MAPVPAAKELTVIVLRACGRVDLCNFTAQSLSESCRLTPRPQVRALVGLEPRKAIKTWVKANLIAQETGVPLTHRLVESVLSKDLPESYRAACADWQDYVHHDSEYYRSPHHIVAAVKRLFNGTIDLDPCSDELAQVGAKGVRRPGRHGRSGPATAL